MRYLHKYLSAFIFPSVILLTETAHAAGPLGIGGLKLGLTRPQVEALKGPVELASPLAEWKPAKPEDYKPAPGELKLEGMLNNPVTGNSKTTLTFNNGRLSYISLDLDDEADLNAAKNLIGGKYGPPKVDNRQKDEQCIYRNGNSFMLKNGMITYKWSQSHGGGVVTTSIWEMLVNICPSNLRYGTTGGISVRLLSIGYGAKPAQASNPF